MRQSAANKKIERARAARLESIVKARQAATTRMMLHRGRVHTAHAVDHQSALA